MKTKIAFLALSVAMTLGAVLLSGTRFAAGQSQFSGGGGGGGGLPSGLNYSAPTLTVSSAGNGNGALALSGNTSGTATFTAPATAGTSTNPVTISNVFAGPNGSASAPTYGFTNCSTCGLYQTGNFTVLNSPSGVALQQSGSTVFNVETTGLLNGSKVLIGVAAPTIAAAGCGGSAASIADNNGPGSFAINVGTAPTSAGCTVTLPTASTAWNCWANDITTNSTSVFLVKQTARSTTGATLVNFSDVAVATAPTASDIWTVHCFAD